MFYDCEIEIQGSKPVIWRTFVADCDLPVSELTKYIRDTMRLRYHNPYRYFVFDNIDNANGYGNSNSYCVVSDKIISEYKEADGNYKSEKDVKIGDLFNNCDYSIFEYDAYDPNKFGWSLKISVLSRKPDGRHSYEEGRIIENESEGYGINERAGDIETQNEEQQGWDDSYGQEESD